MTPEELAAKNYNDQGWTYHPELDGGVWRRWVGRRFFEHWISPSPSDPEHKLKVHYRADDTDTKTGDFEVDIENAGKAFTEHSAVTTADFYGKVFAKYNVQAGVRRFNGPNKTKPKPGPASGAGGEKIGFSELTQTRKLIPFLKTSLAKIGPNPFDYSSESWTKFFKTISPRLVKALLMDMHLVPQNKQAEFERHLTRKLRFLSALG